MTTPTPDPTPNASPAAPEVQLVNDRTLGLTSMIIASALIGLLSWDLMIQSKDLIPHVGLDVEMENRIRAERHDAIAWAAEKNFRWEFYWHNAALNYAYLGVGFGLVWGLLSGFAGRKIIAGLALGVVIGALGGLGGAYLSAFITLETDSVGMADELRTVYDPMHRSMAMHGAGFAMIGLAGGIIVALAGPKTFQMLRLAISGLVAGILGTVAFEIISAVFFQMDRTDLPVPEGDMNKLAFAMVPGMVISLGLWRAISVSKPSPAPTATPETTSTDESVTA